MAEEPRLFWRGDHLTKNGAWFAIVAPMSYWEDRWEAYTVVKPCRREEGFKTREEAVALVEKWAKEPAP